VNDNTIAAAVKEIERYVAGAGWDAPIRVFALIRSAQALATHPELAAELPADVPLAAAENPDALFSVEQEGLPPANSIGELLAQLAWPDTVAGAAITCERVTLPPQAEKDIPADPQEAERFIATDPRREEIRMAVGVLRSGESWCAIRMRSHDNDDEVLGSPDLVPELVEALRATFTEE